MDWIAELIKNAPDIIKAAGSGTLALGAFFLLLGTLLIMYVLKDAAAAWRFSIVVVWLVVGLVLFLIVVGPEPNFRARLEGQNPILGKSFNLDLGYVQEDSGHEEIVDLGLEHGSLALKVTSADAPLKIAWTSGAEVETVHDRGFTRLHVSIPAGSTGPYQTLHARLSPTGVGGLGKAPLDLAVRFARLPASVSIANSSGPKASGQGADFSPPYTVCAPVPQPGTYRVAAESIQVSLSGDRSCNSWSTCQAENRGSSACLVFSLQGHHDCSGGLFGGGCHDEARMSEGHVNAIATLTRELARISADQS
jgi:hypothetical protein